MKFYAYMIIFFVALLWPNVSAKNPISKARNYFRCTKELPENAYQDAQGGNAESSNVKTFVSCYKALYKSANPPEEFPNFMEGLNGLAGKYGTSKLKQIIDENEKCKKLQSD